MKHTRCYVLGAAALALGHWAVPAHAGDARPGDGLEEISDEELGTMRGRYTIGDNAVAWFGVKMISTWQDDAGKVLEGTLALSMDFTQGTQPRVSFEPTVSITQVDAPLPTTTIGNVHRSVDGSGLANVGGLVQSVQVAGDGNVASNVTRLNVQDGDQAPASATTAADHGVASAYGDGASALASFDGRNADVRLTIDGQGAVAQWIHDGSIGQSVQLAADNQWVSNRMELDLVRQSVSANAQLAQNVAQSIALARGIGLR
jgi:hypothetical protein